MEEPPARNDFEAFCQAVGRAIDKPVTWFRGNSCPFFFGLYVTNLRQKNSFSFRADFLSFHLKIVINIGFFV